MTRSPSTHSCRSASDKVRTAFLVAAYTPCTGVIFNPAVEMTLTTCPTFWAWNTGSAAAMP